MQYTSTDIIALANQMEGTEYLEIYQDTLEPTGNCDAALNYILIRFGEPYFYTCFATSEAAVDHLAEVVRATGNNDYGGAILLDKTSMSAQEISLI